jgi:hypothetical protein
MKSTISQPIFFIGLIAVFMSGCSHDTSLPEAAEETPLPDQPYGIRAGIQERLDGLYQRTYQVNENHRFSGYFYLSNEQPAEEFLLTCLLDYRQVPCIYEGEEKMLHPFALGDFEEISIPFETPPLTEGFHDFMLLAFHKPNEHDLSDEYRLRTDISYLTGQRLVLLAGDEPWQKPSIEHAFTDEEPELDVEHLYGILLNQQKEPEVWQAWMRHQVEPGKIIEFYAHLGNKGERDHVFAFMAFMDFIQVPLAGESDWVTFADMPANAQLAVPGRVVAPDEPGVHEFLVVYTADPYQMLEEPPLAKERTLTSYFDYVEPTLRTAIIVQE